MKTLIGLAACLCASLAAAVHLADEMASAAQ